MKVTLSVVLVVLVAACAVCAAPGGASLSRSKRGFRTGAADRFSHGFGKRGQESLIDDVEGNEAVMTTAEMADMLRERPLLINSFVRKYIDMDGDGVVSRDELFGEMRKRR